MISDAGSVSPAQPRKGIRAAGSRWQLTDSAEAGDTAAPRTVKELSAAVGSALSEYMQSLSTSNLRQEPASGKSKAEKREL